MKKKTPSTYATCHTQAQIPSSAILLAHTADWHLRHSQFSRKVRGTHFFRGALSSLEKSHQAGIKYVLNSGDILDRNRQRTCNVRELKLIDQWLVDHDMTMYTITGNHDLDSPTWLETLFGRDIGPGIVPLDNRITTIPGTDFRVGGIPGHNVQELKSYLLTATDLPDIVLWHGGVDGFMGFSAYHVTAKELLEAAPSVKFFALGDLHINQYTTHDNRLAGYPGSTEMCSISEDARKYAVVVELSDIGCKFVKNLVLDTTPVYKIIFTTADEAGESGAWKKSIQAEEFCLIHLTYTQEHVDVVRAFVAQIDEAHTVIRRKRLSTVMNAETREFDLSKTLKSPGDLLPQFQVDPEFSGHMQKLADRNYDPRVVVEQLVQEYAPDSLKAI